MLYLVSVMLLLEKMSGTHLACALNSGFWFAMHNPILTQWVYLSVIRTNSVWGRKHNYVEKKLQQRRDSVLIKPVFECWQEKVLQECFQLLVLNIEVLRLFNTAGVGSNRRNIVPSEIGTHHRRCIQIHRTLPGRLDAERTASQRLNWSAPGLISRSYTT